MHLHILYPLHAYCLTIENANLSTRLSVNNHYFSEVIFEFKSTTTVTWTYPLWVCTLGTQTFDDDTKGKGVVRNELVILVSDVYILNV